MKMIVGLGNPGLKYAGTRHNMGFSALTMLSDRLNIPIKTRQCEALVGHGFIGTEKVLLAMPQTYMNLSGNAVGALAHFYKCDPADIIVIYDDIDLPAGTIRIRAKGSAGSHNGMKSVIQMLGTEDFPRVRVGVGAKPAGRDLADYVLSRFPKEELPLIREAIDTAVSAAELIVREGVDKAQNEYNRSQKSPKKEPHLTESEDAD